MTHDDWPREPKRAADHDPLCHAAAIDYHDPECCDCRLIALVRADERADLRAKVEALPRTMTLTGDDGIREQLVWLADVLALIDGGSR